MYESLVGTGTELITTYGLGVLLVVFVLEGALIGKLIPTRALFVGAVLALGTDTVGLVSVFLAAVVGATVGQFVVFTAVRRGTVPVGTLPSTGGTDGSTRFQQWLDRWGLPVVAVSNVLPVVRGTLTVPAAMGDASALRFSSAAVAGTVVYAGSLVAVAIGVEFLLAAL